MFIISGVMKSKIKWLNDTDGSEVGKIAFGIAILFSAMVMFIALIGILTGCCVGRKC